MKFSTRTKLTVSASVLAIGLTTAAHGMWREKHPLHERIYSSNSEQAGLQEIEYNYRDSRAGQKALGLLGAMIGSLGIVFTLGSAALKKSIKEMKERRDDWL
ncbi:MAG: hypothetical protein Q7S22_06565 [Candidatus Micrarchaeota archaeon]|nr:hypothetical protein [Candidatus Micrarchaeota archaeon]